MARALETRQRTDNLDGERTQRAETCGRRRSLEQRQRVLGGVALAAFVQRQRPAGQSQRSHLTEAAAFVAHDRGNMRGHPQQLVEAASGEQAHHFGGGGVDGLVRAQALGVAARPARDLVRSLEPPGAGQCDRRGDQALVDFGAITEGLGHVNEALSQLAGAAEPSAEGVRDQRLDGA
jgi:hypothetical protein